MGSPDVWYNLLDAERYVYHYTSASTLVHHILPSGLLRFSRFLNVNDPRESKYWRFAYTGGEPGDDASTEAALNYALKHLWRIGCFVCDPYEATITKQREDQGEDILSAVYERGHSRERMWAQYAGNHTGACLVLDKAKLDTEIRSSANRLGIKVFAGKVEYRNPQVVQNLRRPNALMFYPDLIRAHGFEGAVERHIEKHCSELFFLKSVEWQQEREYRWLVGGKKDDDFYVDIRSSIEGVALGDSFPKDLKRHVGEFGKINSTTSIASMNWQNGVPRPEQLPWRTLV